jgi:purine-cytosine permease-like protein
VKALGIASGDAVKIIAFIVIVGIVIFAGIFGFRFIMRIQKWITIVSVVLTLIFISLSAGAIDFEKIQAVPAGNNIVFISAMMLAMTSFGLGWVNAGADYSRYLPRTSSSRGIFAWTTLGAAIAPAVLVVYGFMLAMSNEDLAANIGNDPIGALTAVIPSWFLIPYILLAVAGFMGGAILDIYSSGLNLLTLGFKLKRPAAAAIDGVLMLIGTVYFVWIATNFFWPFQAFLYLLGVPMAAWAGIFIADLILRKRDYDDNSLYDPKGRYGSINWRTVAVMLTGMVVGYGFISSPDESLTWTTWQGYFYRIFDLVDSLGYSNIGVLLALVIGLVGYLALNRSTVAKQEK